MNLIIIIIISYVIVIRNHEGILLHGSVVIVSVWILSVDVILINFLFLLCSGAKTNILISCYSWYIYLVNIPRLFSVV